MTAIPKLGAIWVYLAASAPLGLSITLLAYLFAMALYAKARFSPLVNPVLIAVVLIVALLELTRTPYTTYFQGAEFALFLPGLATVALVLPLYRRWPNLKLLRVAHAEVRGFALGVASHGIGAARAFHVSEEMGAHAGLGMGLSGVFTAIVVPVLLPVLTPWLQGPPSASKPKVREDEARRL
jgi:putative effector of murein hydrolase